MKYFPLLLLSFFVFAQAEAQSDTTHSSLKSSQSKPFFQKIALVSDLGMSNNFSMSHVEEGHPSYLPKARMALGVEVEIHFLCLQLTGNLIEKSPEVKLGFFLLKEKLSPYCSFAQEFRRPHHEPESFLNFGIEGNFDLLSLFLGKSRTHSVHTGIFISPFVEMNNVSPHREKWLQFGFILKPKYNILIHH